MTKCISCGYQHHDVALNCSKCGSFYTEITNDDVLPEKIEQKTLGLIDKLKNLLMRVISTGVHHE